MGANSNIQWTDHTFNPWEGCTKVSAGCAHCYAETRNARFGGGAAPNWGPGKPRRRTSTSNWRQPWRWHMDAEDAREEYERQSTYDLTLRDRSPGVKPHRPRVFCASLADWLDAEVPREWLVDLLELIGKTQELDWQLLTKRPENWFDLMHEAFQIGFDGDEWVSQWLDGDEPENIWIGTSVENQECAGKRIPELLKIPARVRFLSCEPLLGPIDLGMMPVADAIPNIHWVIVGGESGAGARSMHTEWARSLVAQCKAAGMACFVKQLGSKPRDEEFVGRDHLYDTGMRNITLKLNDKKGGDMAEWPEDLRVRDFPP